MPWATPCCARWRRRCATRDASPTWPRASAAKFGLLFPDASLQQAHVVAERIRAAVAAAITPLPDGGQLQVTISIGVASLTAGATLDAAMSDADKALYAAKHQGRNKVVAAAAAE